ncbi:hypothetical protein [Kordiimonas marina]|uniref:hypothetical protein n=1 Tax=Kordiimonas marina TaxID=2872312 RepID=UPI001FF41518|nr:hypothetical protein [Kordiimonas marina]MCJ9430742.1 hypothetical protein [Kordiimonas marina]
MNEKHTSGRWMLVAVMTLAVVLLVGGLYLLVALSQRQTYFEARNFRALNDVAKQLDANLEHPYNAVQCLGDTAGIQQLRATSFYRNADFGEKTEGNSQKVKNTEDGKSEGAEGKPEDSGTIRKEEDTTKLTATSSDFIWETKRHKCDKTQKDAGGSQSGSGTGKALQITIPFQDLIDPSLALDQFEAVAIAREDGTVFFQSGNASLVDRAKVGSQGNLRFSHLKFENQMIGSQRVSLDGLTPKTNDIALMSAAGNLVVPINVGSMKYLIFALPYRLKTSVTEPVCKPERKPCPPMWGNTWTIVGIVKARDFNRTQWKVRLGYSYIFLGVLLLGLFAWPYIKLRFRGPSEPFRMGTLYILLTSGLLGSGLLLQSVVVTFLHFQTEEGFTDAAQSMAGKIRDRLEDELAVSASLNVATPGGGTPYAVYLKQLKGEENKKACGSADSCSKFVPIKLLPNKAGNEAYLQPIDIFAISPTGKLCGNILSTRIRQAVPAGLNLGGREYFRKIVYGGAWRQKPTTKDVVYVDGIRSLTTNGLETEVSRPVHIKDACKLWDKDSRPVVRDVAVVAMALYLTTVEKAVLPDGFRFMVVNRETGDILFHTDDNRRDRENFFAAMEDGQDMSVLLDARSGGEGKARFFYDGSENVGYVTPFTEKFKHIPLSVIVFYDLGRVDLLTIQTGAMAYSLFTLYAVWILILALCWQALAYLLKLDPWAFLWPRSLPVSDAGVLLGLLVIMAVFVAHAYIDRLGIDAYAAKWLVGLAFLPITLFGWLWLAGYIWKPNGCTRDTAAPAVARRYYWRSIVLVLCFVGLPGLLIFHDLWLYQVDRYQHYVSKTYVGDQTRRTRALFDMLDSQCLLANGKAEGLDCTINEPNTADRTTQQGRLARGLLPVGSYGQEFAAYRGPADYVRNSLFDYQGQVFPALSNLDLRIRDMDRVSTGVVPCSTSPQTENDCNSVYEDGSLKPRQWVMILVMAVLVMGVLGYFIQVVGKYLFGTSLAGAPQDLPRKEHLQNDPGRHHMMIRVPDHLDEPKSDGQKTLEKAIQEVLKKPGVRRVFEGKMAEIPDDRCQDLDLSLDTDSLNDWLRQFPLWRCGHPGGYYFRITGFEPPLEDETRRQLLLKILETLSRDNDLILFLIVTVSPLYKLTQPDNYARRVVEPSTDPTADEIHRWILVLEQFLKYYGKPPAFVPQRLNRGYNPDIFIERECNAFFETIRFCEALKKWRSSDDPLNPITDRAMITSKIKDLARGFYRRLWDECTIAERVLLHSMATGDCAHPMHPATGHLLRRGLIRFDPVLRIANDSFTLFIRGAESPKRIKLWRQQISSSAWFYVRIPLLITLAIVAYFVTSYYSDVMNLLVAGIPSTAAALSFVMRFWGQKNLPK